MPRPTPTLTPQLLERMGADYVGRYGGTAQNLRRYLQRTVQQSLRESVQDDAGETAAGWQSAIEAVVRQLVEAGAIDDGRFAEAATRIWQSKGLAAPMVKQRLAARGISSEAAQRALQAVAEDHGPGGNAVRAVAVAYARRRGLGPWRMPDQRAARRDKDLQAMLRAGHPYGVARAVIDGDQSALDPE